MFKPTKILIPTDMSPYSDKAVQQGLEIARQFGAELFLLHVVQDPVQQCTIDYSVSEGLLMQLRTELLQAAEKGICRQLAKFPAASEVKVTTDVKSGTAYDQILQEERERGIDLIVISSLGSTGMAKYVMGSVARHVLLGSKSAVLLVK
jgi:universal stress protein A